MPETIAFTGYLVTVTCWCGIAHAIPSSLNDWAKDSSKNGVYCPLGHRWIRTESEADRLRKQLQREKDNATYLRSSRDQAMADADHQRSRAAGYKGALTKTKKRIAAGVCPCCNRSFVNLARHIAGQHPGYCPSDPPEVTDA